MCSIFYFQFFVYPEKKWSFKGRGTKGFSNFQIYHQVSYFLTIIYGCNLVLSGKTGCKTNMIYFCRSGKKSKIVGVAKGCVMGNYSRAIVSACEIIFAHRGGGVLTDIFPLFMVKILDVNSSLLTLCGRSKNRF